MSDNTSGTKWKWPLIFVFGAIAIIVFLALSKPEPPKSEVKETEWQVHAASIRFERLSPELELLGVTQSPFESELSAAISADVISVPVRVGQAAKKGDTLVLLDRSDIDLVLAQRKADVADAKAQITNEKNRYQSDLASLEQEKALMEIAKKSVARQAKLKASNLVAQERFDQAASDEARNTLSVTSRQLAIADHPARLAQFEARLLRAETALKEAQLDAKRATITAPFDGIVTLVNVAPGERAQIGQTILKLYDQNNMEIRAQIPDRFVSPIQTALTQGLEVSGIVKQYGKEFALSLNRLSGEANRGSGGIDALFVPKPTDSVSSGQTTDNNLSLFLNSTVKLKITLPAFEQVASLPVSSIYGTNRVYRIEDGRIRSIDVEILGRQFNDNSPDHVLVRGEELLSGDQIITTQLPNAISGLKVSVKEG